MDVEQDNHERQRVLYGEPLADAAARIMTALGLTQGRLADALQLSAPMLSQLISAQRVKIGNPAVVHRLQALLQLAEVAPGLTPPQLADRIARIRGEQATLSSTSMSRTVAHQAVLDGLRAVASSAELRQAARGTRAVALARLLDEAAEDAGSG